MNNLDMIASEAPCLGGVDVRAVFRPRRSLLAASFFSNTTASQEKAPALRGG